MWLQREELLSKPHQSVHSNPAIVTGPQGTCDSSLTRRLSTDTSVGRRGSLSTRVAEFMGRKPGGTVAILHEREHTVGEAVLRGERRQSSG